MSRSSLFLLRCVSRVLGHTALFLALFSAVSSATAQVCAAPGSDGSLTVTTAAQTLNSYFPGVAGGAAAGAMTIPHNAAGRRGPTALGAGDLIMIMQMQDGSGGTVTNNASYGFTMATAGTYEFARVVSVAGNVLTLSTPLANTYRQDVTSGGVNQTYQVILVPQYSSLTINSGGSVVPFPWDGTSGGILVVDVGGVFTNNGSVDVSFAGFRGYAGLNLEGQAGAAASTATVFDRVRIDSYPAHGGKGEGTAGTPPRVLNVFSSPGVLRTGAYGKVSTTPGTISATTAFLTTTSRSYNGGSRANGQPANAGGGGDDGNPQTNDQNAGGGGGGNAGAGGTGGNSWASNLAIGGRGGVAVGPSLTTRLTLGGGGGSGTGNDEYGLDTSGGAGGGLIFVKAGSIGGTGNWLARGQGGRSIPGIGTRCPSNASGSCDAAGGGGAGGGMVLLAGSGTIANLQLDGGDGGRVNGQDHGPGGGGGGGYVFTNISVGTPVLTGGIPGIISAGAGGTSNYGAVAGQNGSMATGVTPPANAGGMPIACRPALTTLKVTSTPAATNPLTAPGTTTYSIVVGNASGRGDALGINLYDPTLPGGSATFANPPAPTATFSATPALCGNGTRTSTVNPANGASNGLVAGVFTLPAGCTVTYTFSVNIPATMPAGTFQNSAVAWFTDPTSSDTSRTVTAALPAAATAITASTTFSTGGAVGGSNYDGNNAANTGENIRVVPSANLQLVKSNGVNSLPSGSITFYNLTVSNQGPADGAGTVLRDPAATGLSCTGVACSFQSGAATCPAPAGTTIAALQGSGITLTSLPASSSLTFTVSCNVTATGV